MGEFNVGNRLREIREDKGLSQRELADVAGVTNGAISLIERNKTSPSISSLKRILSVFSMTLSDFFTDTNAETDTFVFRAGTFAEINPARLYDNMGAGELEQLSLTRLGSQGSDNALLMLLETYAPGADTGEELYSHAGEEVGYVLSGEIELTVGDKTELLRAGDAYQFPSTRPHRFRNIGKGTCVIISACTPPTF